MPASEFTWNNVPSTPVFQVYGTKRKATDTDETWQNNSNSHGFQDGMPAKRVCPWNAEMVKGYTNNVQAAEINHNHLTTAPHMMLSQQQQQMQQQATLEQEHRNMFANCVPWSSEEVNAAVQNSSENFSMDLNEGTYSNSQIPADLMADHAAMESDCCPDPEQYQLTPNTPAKRAVQQSQDIRSDFCTNYCGGGDSSPSSGIIRCYCKPSWEGMMDMKPYISDYY